MNDRWLADSPALNPAKTFKRIFSTGPPVINYKKEIIEEVVVSDRTSPITNPRTNESLRAVEASGEDGPQRDGQVSF